MDAELKAAVMNKEGFIEFIALYFEANNTGEYVFVNKHGERLPVNTAYEFYEDYINSRLSMENYKKQTQSEWNRN